MIISADLGSTGIVGTGGSSEESRWLAREVASERQHLRESYALGGAGNDAFRRFHIIGWPNDKPAKKNLAQRLAAVSNYRPYPP